MSVTGLLSAGSSRIRTIAGVAVTMAAVLLGTGCAVPGHPVAVTPDLRALDIGQYGFEPLTVPSTSNEQYGRVVESVRMAEAIINPLEADPAFNQGLGPSSAIPVPTPDKAAFLAEPVRAVLGKYRMLAGFAVGAADREIAPDVAVGRARLLTVMLLRFPDAATARSAAEEIDSVDAAVSPDNVAVDIPEHRAAHSHWRPTVPTLAATIARDSFVVSVLVGDLSPDLAALTTLVRKTFDSQLGRLAGFAMTPPEKFATLPLDQEGMLAKLVPATPGEWPFPEVFTVSRDSNAGWRNKVGQTGVVYGPRGASLLTNAGRGPGETKQRLVALNDVNYLIRHPDARSARVDYVASADEVSTPGQREAAAPTGIPDIRCLEWLAAPPKAIRFGCHLVHGRYEAILFGVELKQTQQRAAAQFGVLVQHG